MKDFTEVMKANHYNGTLTPYIPTREEVISYYDELIANNEKQWGTDHFYTDCAREDKEKAMMDYNSGKAVIFAEDSWHHGFGFYGIDYTLLLYSDGSYKLHTYM